MNYQRGDKIKTKHGELTIEEVHINEERIMYKCPHGDGFVYVEHGEVEREWMCGDKVRIVKKDEYSPFDIGEEVTLVEFDRTDPELPWRAEGRESESWISEEEAELI